MNSPASCSDPNFGGLDKTRSTHFGEEGLHVGDDCFWRCVEFLLQQLHDFIRMLDAEGYPPAFLECDGFRFEFTRAALYDNRIVSDVKITRIPQEVAKT